MEWAVGAKGSVGEVGHCCREETEGGGERERCPSLCPPGGKKKGKK